MRDEVREVSGSRLGIVVLNVRSSMHLRDEMKKCSDGRKKHNFISDGVGGPKNDRCVWCNKMRWELDDRYSSCEYQKKRMININKQKEKYSIDIMDIP
jgi:hypothetical protein